jgi:hypothetical protein
MRLLEKWNVQNFLIFFTIRRALRERGSGSCRCTMSKEERISPAGSVV